MDKYVYVVLVEDGNNPKEPKGVFENKAMAESEAEYIKQEYNNNGWTTNLDEDDPCMPYAYIEIKKCPYYKISKEL